MMLMSSSIFVPAVEIRADKTPEPQTVAFDITRISSSTCLVGLRFTLDFPSHPSPQIYIYFH